MSAARTLLNKQGIGRKPGALSAARAIVPISRARRMATPFGTISVSNDDRIKRAAEVVLSRAERT